VRDWECHEVGMEGWKCRMEVGQGAVWGAECGGEEGVRLPQQSMACPLISEMASLLQSSSTLMQTHTWFMNHVISHYARACCQHRLCWGLPSRPYVGVTGPALHDPLRSPTVCEPSNCCGSNSPVDCRCQCPSCLLRCACQPCPAGLGH
jgi:hypothetical protein